MPEQKKVGHAQHLKAVNHPIRREILKLVNEEEQILFEKLVDDNFRGKGKERGYSTLNEIRNTFELDSLPVDEEELTRQYDEMMNEVIINCDEGRLRRSLLVISDGKILLTEKYLEDLQKERIGWGDLIEEGIIEYLDAEEEENALIALNNALTVSGCWYGLSCGNISPV